LTKLFDYEIIYTHLINLIENELNEHEKIPSENSLCELFNVTRATVRQGINKAKSEGLIYSKKGSGNFVSPKKIVYSITPNTTFTKEILKIGKKPKLKFIGSKIIEADEFIAEKLEINIGDKVLYVKNLRLVDDIPFLFAKYFINLKLIENAEKRIKNTDSISKLYEQSGLSPIRDSSEIDIIPSTIKSKSIFQVQHDFPIIKIATKTTDINTKEVIDYCFSNFRSDMAKIVVDYKGEK